MAERNRKVNLPQEVCRLRDEHKKVISDCEGQIKHWEKVSADYDVLQERLCTLPDKLSYDVMVPFGPLAFMPGKLIHTNELTVLLGDNWFARCSAKQAVALVEHRKRHVKGALDDLNKVAVNFERRMSFTQDLQGLSGDQGNYVDIREEVESEELLSKGKKRLAHKPNSRPRVEEAVLQVVEEEEEEEEREGAQRRPVLSEEELWARLDELEAQEQQLDEQYRASDDSAGNGEDATSSSSEEEKDGGESQHLANGLHQEEGWRATPPSCHDNGTGQHNEEEPCCVPTIYFSHMVEPKKVRINTGKNTTLKFSERKEEAKRKRSNSGSSNGHALPERPRISSPADIYRLFVDVVNGELVPRKSILKSRSRENSVCSDTSESSTADPEERRAFARSLSHDDASESSPEEGVGSPPTRPTPLPGLPEAFSGTVVEKDPGLLPSVPHLTIAPPALPTIPERKSEEVFPEAPQDPPKRLSKFKAARLQQK